MKIKKEGNRYLLDLDEKEMLLLQNAVEYGAEWMCENGYGKEEKRMRALHDKLIK